MPDLCYRKGRGVGTVEGGGGGRLFFSQTREYDTVGRVFFVVIVFWWCFVFCFFTDTKDSVPNVRITATALTYGLHWLSVKTQNVSLALSRSFVQCCQVHRRGAQDVHLDFLTAPEL